MADPTEWAERVAAWRASGLTAKAYCSGREFTAGSLHTWSSQLRRKADERGAVQLARVVRVRDSTSERHGMLVVELAGARVHVPPDVDRRALACVVDVLRQQRS